MRRSIVRRKYLSSNVQCRVPGAGCWCRVLGLAHNALFGVVPAPTKAIRCQMDSAKPAIDSVRGHTIQPAVQDRAAAIGDRYGAVRDSIFLERGTGDRNQRWVQ